MIKETTLKVKIKCKIEGSVPDNLLEDVIYSALVNGGSISGEDYLLLLPNHISLAYKYEDFIFEVLITERELCR